MWARVSSSTPHLHEGLLVSPIKWRCLLRVLYPVRRQILTLDCVLLKDKSLVFALRVGSKINSRFCLWVLPRPTYPSKSPIKEPPHHVPQHGPNGERYSVSRASGLFIHLDLSESPVKEPSHVSGENIWTLYLYSRGRKAYIQWVRSGSPRGLFMTLLSLPQFHAAFSIIPSTLVWVDQTPLSQCVSSWPSTGCPPPQLLPPPTWPRVK
jgi:hypothetical protein